MSEFENSNPEELWSLFRDNELTKQTSGMCDGYTQANLVVLPKKEAFDFMVFAQRNPKPVPVLDVTEPGEFEPKFVAPGSDLRTDLPKYRIYENGELIDEPYDILDYWDDDFVGFLLGCSFTFERALIDASIPVRHREEDKNVPMYITDRDTTSGGIFSGPLVVTMRPIPIEKVVKAVKVTSRFPRVHGAPIHIGDPSEIGIEDLDVPDYGDSVNVKDGEVPVFWACGVTSQAAALEAEPDLMITHAPGHMFITNRKDEEYSVL